MHSNHLIPIVADKTKRKNLAIIRSFYKHIKKERIKHLKSNVLYTIHNLKEKL
jgi:hypothetical protein